MTTAAALEVIRTRTTIEPEIGIILGTGLDALAREVENPVRISYAELPGFRTPTVETHAGEMILGTLAGKPVVLCSGRFHLYEGYSVAEVVHPIRVIDALGATTLIVTNISGGMHPLWGAGDIVLIADHINLTGSNPLIGPNDDALGPRFPDMSDVYSRALRELARRAALELKIVLREGVYVAVLGPSLETPAEYRMLRLLGADILGMSTVPEVIAAVHQGMAVLGLSIVTNQSAPESLQPVSVAQVIAIARDAEPKLAGLIKQVISSIRP